MENQFTDSQDNEYTLDKEQRGQRIVRDLLTFIGEDPTREGLLQTPHRVIKSYKKLFGGYSQDPKLILGTTFKSDNYDQMVICKDIEMFSTCEHHMIPFFGKVHIGYVPKGRIVGLSKLARLVEIFARRLQVQEKLTQDVADSFQNIVGPHGVMVVIKAKHMCMCSRGVGKQHSEMITSAMTGVFQNKPEVRQEFLELIK